MQPGQAAPPALADLAARLTDMATHVAREAETAASSIRALVDQAHQVADLAAALDDAAAELEAEVRQQNAALGTARDELADHRPAVAALERSPDRLASISRTIAELARQTNVLSINARIEAARSGPEARGFAAVASEMSGLASQTKQATGDIGQSADLIAHDVRSARAIVISQDALVANQTELLGSALDSAARQRKTAAALAALAAEGADRVDVAASSVGRVGATAIAVKMLAREIARRA